MNWSQILKDQYETFYQEDDLSRNVNYLNSLSSQKVKCQLKLKDDLILAGLPFFFEAFNFISSEKIDYQKNLVYEGATFQKSENKVLEFELPFNIALTGERIALNLLQRASSVATYTNQFVKIAKKIKILDTEPSFSLAPIGAIVELL